MNVDEFENLWTLSLEYAINYDKDKNDTLFFFFFFRWSLEDLEKTFNKPSFQIFCSWF